MMEEGKREKKIQSKRKTREKKMRAASRQKQPSYI
jgi:hypothetical protein